MRKLFIYFIVTFMVVGVCFIASKTKTVDFTNRYLERASFYGLKNMVNQEDLEQENYSHLDAKFWGVPELK